MGQSVQRLPVARDIGIFYLQIGADRAHIDDPRPSGDAGQPGRAVGGVDNRAMRAFGGQHNRQIIRRRVALPLHQLLPPLHRELGQKN